MRAGAPALPASLLGLERKVWRVQALGVAGYFGAADVPGDNAIGAIIHDEELFATTEVSCVGQVRSRRAPTRSA